MKIQQLEYIIAIAQAGSITAAAKNLYQAQPNISIALKDLESEIGMQIFWRTPNGMVLTPEGEQFLLRARDIVESMHSLEADYTNRSEDGISLKIAVSRSSYTVSSIGAWVNSLSSKEKIKISLRNVTTNNVIDEVSSGKADVGFLRIPEHQLEIYNEQMQNRKLVSKELTKFKIKLLMNKECELAKYDVVPASELKNYIEIGHADDEINSVGKTYFNNDSDVFSDANSIRICDMGAKLILLEQVPNSYMWTPPTSMSYFFTGGKLVVRDCDLTSMNIHDIAIYKKGSETNRIIKSYVDFLAEYAMDLYNKYGYTCD